MQTLESQQAADDGEQVTTLEKVHALEELLGGDAQFLSGRRKRANVLYAGEVRDWLLDFLHHAGLDSVGQFAKKGAILQQVVKVVSVATRGDVLLGDGLDPLEHLLRFLLVEFSSLLLQNGKAETTSSRSPGRHV